VRKGRPRFTTLHFLSVHKQTPREAIFFILCQILLVAIQERHQLLPTNIKEAQVSNVVWVPGKRNFDPEDLHELGVAFENCCAAIPDTKSQEFREQLAWRLISWAPPGTQLYTRALQTYRALQRI
jgi:hypothetical protein